MKRDTVKIEKLAQGGDGLGHLSDGRIVFVPGAFPGDVVEIELTKQKDSWARGRVTNIREPSPARRSDPECPHDDVCGGCTFRLLEYPEEFRAKVEAARDALERIGKLEVPDGKLLEATAPDGYRVRAQLHTRHGKTGYFDAGSRDLFGLRQCPALDPRLGDAVDGVVSAMRVVDHGEVQMETADDEHGVVVIDSKQPVVDEVLDEIIAIDRIAGVRLNDPSGTRKRGEVSVATDEAIGVESSVRMEPGLFRQSNAQMNDVLRQQVVERTGSGQHLVELFCGAGNFTFALADEFSALEGYESSVDAIRFAQRVADELKLDHVRFRQLDLSTETPVGVEGATVLLDPPRTGAAEVTEMLATSEASRIVYVSCDPATLARDLRTLLEEDWTLDTVDFVDMFPRTAHLETIAVVTPTG